MRDDMTTRDGDGARQIPSGNFRASLPRDTTAHMRAAVSPRAGLSGAGYRMVANKVFGSRGLGNEAIYADVISD